MKKYNEEDIICTAGKGITVVLDEEHALRLSSQYHQGCIAIKDVNMGYGIFFTKNGTSGVYGPKGIRILLDNYWDANASEICSMLNEAWNTNDIEEIIKTGAEIIVSCSMKAAEAFEKFKQFIVA